MPQKKIERNNYETRFKSPYSEEMSKKPVSVMLPVDIDEFVRSLPNRTDWLRSAIAEKYEREKESADSNSFNSLQLGASQPNEDCDSIH